MEFLVLYFFVMVERFGALLNLGWAFFWGGLVIMACTMFFASMASIESDHKTTASDILKQGFWAKAIKICKWSMIVGLILGSLSYLVPTQKDLAIIVGGGITYQAVTSETGKRIGGKAINLLEQKVDAALADKMPDTPKADTPKPNKQAL